MDYNTKKFHLSLGLILLAIAMMRFLLITKGHFHMQDELRYRYSFVFIRELVELQPMEALRQSFAFPLFARPLLVLFNLPTALLQVVLLVITGIKTETPLSLSLASGFQVLVTLGITWALYRLFFWFLKSHLLSLTGVIVYSLLINTNLYIRHILPYDITLLIYLWWTWLVLIRYENWNWRWSFGSGLLMAALHLVYPAYYLFGLIIGGLVTWLPGRRWLVRGIIFTTGFLLVLIVTETVAQLVGASYLQTAKFVTGRVIVGDPRETLWFLWRYLIEVEGLIGILLATGFSVFLIHMIWKPKQYPKELRVLSLMMLGAYVLHGLSGPLLGKVFYGRSVRMFFWWVVLSVMLLIRQSKKDITQYMAVLGIIIITTISFMRWYPNYLRLQYPGDVLFNLVGADYVTRVSEVNENYAPDSKENHPREQADFLAINFGRWFFPEKQTYIYDAEKYKLIFQSPHPINFIAYQFEGLSPKERQLIKDRNYQMKLNAK